MENIPAKQNLHLQTNFFHQFQAYWWEELQKHSHLRSHPTNITKVYFSWFMLLLSKFIPFVWKLRRNKFNCGLSHIKFLQCVKYKEINKIVWSNLFLALLAHKWIIIINRWTIMSGFFRMLNLICLFDVNPLLQPIRKMHAKVCT